MQRATARMVGEREQAEEEKCRDLDSYEKAQRCMMMRHSYQLHQAAHAQCLQRWNVLSAAVER